MAAEVLTEAALGSKPEKNTNYGRLCIFFVRASGSICSIFLLIVGFVTLLPFGVLSVITTRCIGVGFIFIITSVIMFFLEVSVLGHCVPRLAFLLVIHKRLKHWHRAVIYMGLSVAPLALWCIAPSSIIGMISLFSVGALNLTTALGKKGDHTEQLAARWQKLGDEEMDTADDGDNTDNTDKEIDKENDSKL